MLYLRSRTDYVAVLQEGRTILRLLAPRKGGQRSLKLLEAWGILQEDGQTGDWIVRSRKEGELVDCLQQVGSLDLRKLEDRTIFSTLYGLVSGLTDSVEKIV